MASSRDDVDSATRTDLQALFAAAPGFAAQQIERGGAFHPYAAYLGVDDQIGHMAADAELIAENPAPQAIIDSLTAVLTMGGSELRATAVVSDSDADSSIAVHLEHRDGISVRVAIPYTRTADGVTVHEPGAIEPTPAIIFA